MTGAKTHLVLNSATKLLGSLAPSYNSTLWLRLIVGTPIFPGQTVVFRWESDRVGFTPPNLGAAASISLQLVDDFGNLDPNGLLYSNPLSNSDLDAVVSQHGFSSQIVEVQLTDEMAKRIYTVGTKRLRLLLQGTGSLGVIQSADETLVVQLPTIDDTWWTWNVPSHDVEWKKPYTVAGSLTNNAVAAATALVTLLETNTTDTTVGEMSLATDTIGSLIGSGQNVAVTFGGLDLTKKWSWFTTGVWVAYAANPQVFRYRVRLDITDQFQNGYPPFFTTMNTNVTVTVSNTKTAACAMAYSLQAAAAGGLVAAAAVAIVYGFGEIAAAVLVGTASGLEAASLISGAVAGDPPIPDPRFQLLVKPSPIRLTQAAEGSDLAPFLNAIFDVLAHIEAMGETDSRIAGARTAHDHRWEQAQTDHFNALRGKLASLARHISSTMLAAAGSLAKSGEKATPEASDDAIHRLGHDLAFRSQIFKLYTEAGGAATGFDRLLARASAADFGGGIANPVAVFVVAGLTSEKLAAAAGKVKPTAPFPSPR